ncbi:MAG: hypothetical protein COZ18_03360 [Flexibacter sp. CG_4_10_14_3_um_filter_32_15]|nr:MAG: hypothetical protein COZ18_03360 [Flexibacter sp. CG_4_10_14_3_um_filter_32_15]
MKFKHLIFALLTVASASSFTGCNESTPDPKTPETPCVTCEDEHIVSEIIDYEGVIMPIFHRDIDGQSYIASYGISIKKEEHFTFSQDSFLIPCPTLPIEFQNSNQKVIISGNLKSCDRLLTHPEVHVLYGRKFDLISIKKH